MKALFLNQKTLRKLLIITIFMDVLIGTNLNKTRNYTIFRIMIYIVNQGCSCGKYLMLNRIGKRITTLVMKKVDLKKRKKIQ